MKYVIQITMIDHRQVEIEANADLDVKELANLARQKARSEYGDADVIEIDQIESDKF